MMVMVGDIREVFLVPPGRQCSSSQCGPGQQHAWASRGPFQGPLW